VSRANPTASTVRVVYVHGSGPQPGPQDLKRALDGALFGSDQGTRTQVAYYADILHPAPVAETLRALAQVIRSAPAELTHDTEALTDLMVADVDPHAPAAAATVRRVASSIASRMTGDARAARAGDTSVSAILPGWLRAFLFRFVVRFLLRDAHAYFFEGRAGPIRQRVREILDASDMPAVVIGHSLGSVVAYDVLSEAPVRARAVPLFVTVGSPLGVDAVKDQVHQPPVVPPGVAAWLNVSDPLDIVAADRTLADDYRGAVGLIQDVFVDNRALFPHDLVGYLRVPEVQSAMREASSGGKASWNR
jgi:hypothetical protein